MRGKKRMAGEGSIYRRSSDGRWVATISRGPRTGRQTVTRYTRSKAEAQLALAEIRESVGPLDARSLTTGAYLERWVRDARDIRPSTRSGYESVVRTHLLPLLGAVRLSDLSPLHIEALLSALSPRLSPKSLRNVHVVLRRALGQAVRAGLVRRNVASREYVDTPKVTIEEPDALTMTEINRIRAVLPGHPLEAHVTVALGTGLRQGEQLGLAWQDIEAGSLKVRKELARIDGKYQRVEPKTSRSKRTIPLAPPVAAAIARHREQLMAQGYVPTSTGPVFVNSKGGPLNGSWLTHRWYGLLALAKVERRPWKILRATFASRLYAAGVPERTIADLMGHSRTHTTQRHYVATDSEIAVEAIGRLVG